ncbi:hypothetical protein ACLOJK_016948 [Asimina triloba]
MKRPDEESPSSAQRKYVGVRRRKWGKWVSEIRVPTTRARLWLGSYRTPEAAAVAHDTAVFCLHGPPSIKDLNFPSWVPATARTNLSPDSIQQAAAAAGMDADARLAGGFLKHVHAAAAIKESSGYSASRDDDHGRKSFIDDHMAADAGGFLEHVHAAAAIGESSCYSASSDDDHGRKLFIHHHMAADAGGFLEHVHAAAAIKESSGYG